jgi:putative restriction endonuclease
VIEPSPAHRSWLERLSVLRQDRARGAAPHKPLLLLVVLDLVEEGKLASDLMPRDGSLAFRFSSYWTIIAYRRTSRPDVRLPFYHMRSDGFWTPLDADGKVSASRETAALAQFDPAFLECAEDAGFRKLARRTLIARYFEPNERAELYRLCGLEVPPDDLVAADAARFLRSDQDESKRDAKFSVRVLPAYDFTCALTRYRMIAIDGSTPLDAAHIQQFKRGGPCEPSNGIALSKTAHWLFDRGFWSIADDYRVVVKSGAFEEAGEASQLLKPHAGRQILLPNTRGLWPNPLFLGWHRANHGFEGIH